MMKMYTDKNNIVNLRGRLEAAPIYCRKILNEEFYSSFLAVERLSGKMDVLPITIPGKVLKEAPIASGDIVSVRGQYRSCNEHMDGKTRLKLFVYVMEFTKEADSKENEVLLDGYICRPPVYRKTPLGREIADILLAVNRLIGSDYIPCICWGRNARRAEVFEVGNRLTLRGRIQSREYIKVEDDQKIMKTAYEVSVNQIL